MLEQLNRAIPPCWKIFFVLITLPAGIVFPCPSDSEGWIFHLHLDGMLDAVFAEILITIANILSDRK